MTRKFEGREVSCHNLAPGYLVDFFVYYIYVIYNIYMYIIIFIYKLGCCPCPIRRGWQYIHNILMAFLFEDETTARCDHLCVHMAAGQISSGCEICAGSRLI